MVILLCHRYFFFLPEDKEDFSFVLGEVIKGVCKRLDENKNETEHIPVDG